MTNFAALPTPADPAAHRPSPRGVSTSMVQVVLTTAAIAVALCGGVWLFASSSRPDASSRIVLLAVLALPAAYYAVIGSSLLLDHFLLIVVVNRLLRRLLDWGEGRYDPLPLLSLLPMFIAFLMLFRVQQNWRNIPASMRQAFWMLTGAIVYAMAIGFAGYGFPAVYAGAEYVTPLIVMYYCVSCRPTAGVQKRWLTVLATLGILTSVYGIMQWFDVPRWDAAWLIWSGMFSSQGGAEAFRMSIMSTLESRGPASQFFATIAVIFVGLPFLRQKGGIVLGILPAIALLLTTARTGLGYGVFTLIGASVLARGRAGFKMIFALLVVAAGAFILLGRQSESNLIFDRVATIGSIQSDGSALGRVDIAQRGLGTVLSTPQGYGFGSGGNATKAASKAGESDAVGDNGYLEILSTLGLPGAALYFGGLFTILKQAFRDRGLATGAEPATNLGLGMALAALPALIIGNCLTTAHGAYLWILLSRHLAASRQIVHVRRRLLRSTAVPAAARA